MTPLATLQLAAALILILIFPVMDLAVLNRLKQNPSTAARLHAYRHIHLHLWPAAALALLLLLCSHVNPFAVPPAAADGTWTSAIFATLSSSAAPSALSTLRSASPVYLLLCTTTAAYFLGAFVASTLSLLSPSVRKRYSKALDRLRFLLPVTPPERRAWILISLAAGFCEELLYRGFLFQFLRGHLAFHAMPALALAPAFAVMTLCFGTSHLYQGLRGILTASIAGLMLGLAALLTGSLWLPMLLHFLIDLQVLALYRPTLDDPTQAQTLEPGVATA